MCPNKTKSFVNWIEWGWETLGIVSLSRLACRLRRSHFIQNLWSKVVLHMKVQIARLSTCFVWTVLGTNLALGLTGNNSLRSYQHFLLHRLSQWGSISRTHLTMIIAENLNFQQQELSLNHWWIFLEGIGVQKLKFFSCVPNWIVLVFNYINISDFFFIVSTMSRSFSSNVFTHWVAVMPFHLHALRTQDFHKHFFWLKTG